MHAPRLPVAAAVLVLALVVRLAPLEQVYGGAWTRLTGDSDSHAHVLRAEAWLAGAEGAPWHNPKISWPAGADEFWPPLFDALIAGTARVLVGSSPSREEIARVAAPIPVFLALLVTFAVALLGRRLPRRGWVAAFLFAVLPLGSAPSVLGRTDQHVLEVLLVTLALLLFGDVAAPEGAPSPRWRTPALAVVLTLAFWTWTGSALHLIVLVAILSFWHVREDEAADRGAGALAAGGLGGAALLATSVALLGPPGALHRAAIGGVGLLHVALLASTGAGAAALFALRRLRAGAVASTRRRILELASAGALPAIALLALAPIRAGITSGMTALFAGNAWYARINEYRPLLGSGAGIAEDLRALLSAYGLAHVAAAAGVVAILRGGLPGAERNRSWLSMLLVTFALLAPAALARRRIGIYAVLPVALLAEAGIAWASERLRPLLARRLPRFAASSGPALVLAAVVALPVLPEHLAPEWVMPGPQEELLRFTRSTPVVAGAEAIVTPWSFGHVARYYSDRPVVATPFGTEAGGRSMEDTAALWFSTAQRDAEAVMRRRHAGLLLVAQPVTEAVGLHAFAPDGTPIAIERVRGGTHGGPVRDTERFWRMVPNRLFFDDGRGTASDPPLDGFRLLWETPSTHPANPALDERWALFESIRGARVIVRAPGGRVRATVTVETNLGRRFVWESSPQASPGAPVVLRLPYASGPNGGSRATEWTITDGSSSVRLVVHEGDVRDGRFFEVSLSETPPLIRRVGPL